MDTPPINKLLQLLRQKLPEPADPSSRVPRGSRRSKPRPIPTCKMSLKPAKHNGIQSDTGDPQYAAFGGEKGYTGNTQYATESGTQHTTSNIQSAVDRSIPYAVISSTQYTTGSDIPLAIPGLSKGQHRTLQFLLANRDRSEPSRTMPIGYHAISSYCFLSRNGSRKVIEELCKKRLITRLTTQRGGMQGSVYALESSIQSATKSGIPHPLRNPGDTGTQYATFEDSCSSNKLLLQGLLLDDAFCNLNPRSLEPYLEQFETTEDLQNFLDIANACIAASKVGRGKPIQNPHGFLLAQLRAGYINPPEGYKSRKVRAQEMRNQQLEEELATLRQLKAQERELRLALFEASLTDEEQQRLEQEARTLVNPNIGLSTARQIEIQKDAILKAWFEQREKDKNILGAAL